MRSSGWLPTSLPEACNSWIRRPTVSTSATRRVGMPSLIDRPWRGRLHPLLAVLLDPREIVASEEGDQQVAPVALRQPRGELADVDVEQVLQGAFGVAHLVHEGEPVALEVRPAIAVVVDIHDQG